MVLVAGLLTFSSPAAIPSCVVGLVNDEGEVNDDDLIQVQRALSILAWRSLLIADYELLHS